MRVPQPKGERGSLKWIQRAVAERWPELSEPMYAKVGSTAKIEWLSPLAEDQFAEYRDGAFLSRLGLGQLAGSLGEFWPERGPQWDALAIVHSRPAKVVLVEAKAHIGEFCTPPSGASEHSLSMIQAALRRTASALGVPPSHTDAWLRYFYQYTNRLAHLLWLREQQIDAKLLFVGFVNDDEMPGKTTPEAWQAAYLLANYVLGLKVRHVLAAHVMHAFPDVALYAQ